MRYLKRALFVSVLFCFLCLISGLISGLIPGHNPAHAEGLTDQRSSPQCPPRQIDQTATVERVHDGDTIRLTDGRKLRLIGINTPELARDKRPAEALSLQARQHLVKQLRHSSNRIGLSFGKQKHDRYGRLLAHIYRPDGNNLQTSLLAAGLATAFTTPPNDRQSSCYRQVERQAQSARRGIWALPDYQVKTLFQLSPRDRGFRRISGKVSETWTSNKAFWIKLGQKVKIRINKKDLVYFNAHKLNTLQGKNIQVRGWLHPQKQSYFINLRHPDALMIK